MTPRFVLISPCRNEARYMRRTLDSVLAQTVLPDLWVVVDDGSSDETGEILAEYAAKHPLLSIVRRHDRGKRSVGPGVVESFYAGLETIDLDAFDFLCKLDMDLDLPPRYFEILLERMAAEPRLGTCSGKPYDLVDGELVSEACGDETSVGMTKFYRRECFVEIGGFVHAVMWDGIDCHRCRMAGWMARSWDEPELRFVHLRPMGSSEGNLWEGRKRHGRGQHFMGTSLLYMTVSAVFRMTKPPIFVGGLAMWLGFVARALRGDVRYGDDAFRSFLRRFQWECLVFGKRRAMERCDARQAEVFARARASAVLPGAAALARDEA